MRRVNAFTLSVPPLYQRLDDIVPLAEHFLSHFENHYQRRTLGFSDQARSAMYQYRWPGNVRELKNCVERGVILTADNKHITEKALFGDYRVQTLEREKAQCLDETGMLIPTSDDNSSNVSPRERIQPLLDAGMTLEEVERALIQAANSDSGGNITAAAQRLGMTRAAYAYRLKKHRL